MHSSAGVSGSRRVVLEDRRSSRRGAVPRRAARARTLSRLPARPWPPRLRPGASYALHRLDGTRRAHGGRPCGRGTGTRAASRPRSGCVAGAPAGARFARPRRPWSRRSGCAAHAGALLPLLEGSEGVRPSRWRPAAGPSRCSARSTTGRRFPVIVTFDGLLRVPAPIGWIPRRFRREVPRRDRAAAGRTGSGRRRPPVRHRPVAGARRRNPVQGLFIVVTPKQIHLGWRPGHCRAPTTSFSEEGGRGRRRPHRSAGPQLPVHQDHPRRGPDAPRGDRGRRGAPASPSSSPSKRRRAAIQTGFHRDGWAPVEYSVTRPCDPDSVRLATDRRRTTAVEVEAAAVAADIRRPARRGRGWLGVDRASSLDHAHLTTRSRRCRPLTLPFEVARERTTTAARGRGAAALRARGRSSRDQLDILRRPEIRRRSGARRRAGAAVGCRPADPSRGPDRRLTTPAARPFGARLVARPAVAATVPTFPGARELAELAGRR